MSLQSWKDEFYPTTADEATMDNAIDHCILKWEGLRKENLDKHEIDKRTYGSIGDNTFTMQIDGSTCALCKVYMDEDSDDCGDCPLFLARGEIACDSETDNEYDNEESPPYQQWSRHTNPEPMIFWLKKAKEF